MGADTTLVTAAFKEAETRAGVEFPNLKPLYDINRAIGTEPFKVIMGLADQARKEDEIRENGRKKQFAKFKETVNGMYKSLAEDKNNISNKAIDAIEKAIRELQDEFEAVNTYGNNDTAANEKARYRIEGELNKLVKGAVNLRFGLMNMQDIIKNTEGGDVDPEM